MMRPSRLLMAMLAILSMATVSQGAIVTYKTLIGMTGAQEAPNPVNSQGYGFGKVVYDSTNHLLHLRASWNDLTGTTTNSHIHAPTAVPGAGTAGVATTTPTFAGFPSGVHSGTYVNTLDLTLASSYNPAFVTANGGTTASAEVALINALNQGRAYWNIHSTFSAPGEIRGFLTQVPEPASLTLLALGAAGLLIRRRR